MATSTIKMTNSGSDTSNGGYCKIGDGTLIQWGSVTVPSGEYTAVITFPISFINKDKISIQITPLTGGTAWNINYSGVTTSQANLGRTPNSSNSVYYWLAVGRWK